MQAIQTEALSRHFGMQRAVDGIALRVPPATVYGFLGGNGAGKSTTIRLLLGLLRPSAGSIHLFGRELRAGTRGDLLREIGSLVEWPALYDNLTARENLRLNARLLGCRPSRVAAVLELMDLADSANRLVAQYSLGMRQRLGLAIALLHEPKLLILDEPTNGLDPAGIREMRELLRELPRSTGTTVFVSSHLLDEVSRIADHVGVLHAGRLCWQGPLAELQGETTLEIGALHPQALMPVLQEFGLRVESAADDQLTCVRGLDQRRVAELSAHIAASGAGLYHLRLRRQGLEELFFGLTHGAPDAEVAA